MELTFLYAPGFIREWGRLRLNDDDLLALEEEIDKAPGSAPIIQGTGGLRKIRFAPPSMHSGKRGATRVGFAYIRVKSAVIVVAIYAKNEAANLSPEQKRTIAKWLKMVEKEFR